MKSASEPNPAIYSVEEATFQERVVQASHVQPVMVDFWAEWCAPCLSLAPALERVIGELEGRVVLAKVEVDDNMRLAGHYRLRGFPTVILFRDGEEIGRFHGSRQSHWLRDWISEHLGPQGVATVSDGQDVT
ncbi:MAG: thioredoxin domain-containing protein [Candidatus Thiodiazotropha sp.]